MKVPDIIVSDRQMRVPKTGCQKGGRIMKRTKRLSINIPEEVYKELQQTAETSGVSMTRLVRNALGLIDVAYKEKKAGNKMTISTSNDMVIKEIMLTA